MNKGERDNDRERIMIKRRIVSAFIVLLFVLVIAVPVFFSSAAKEESTVQEGRVTGISIGKGKAFHGIGDGAEKDFKDLELLELLETARVHETEDLDLTSQQMEALEAYEAFLENYAQNYDGEEFENSRGFQGPKFTLVYLNDDEIPELVIADNLQHARGTDYYIYEDGEVVLIGEYGQYGQSRYAEKASMIFDQYDGAEVAHYWTYLIEDTEEVLLQSSDLYIHWDIEYEGPEYTYIVDDKEVSEEEYRAVHNIWDDYEKKTVAYDKCFLMMDGNIRENLDKAMAELMYGEDLLAYWRVLNNQQPFVSTDEDYQEFYWDEYDWWLGRRQVEYRRADKFMVVDMDGDGGNEVVLYCWPESTQVLHYEDGVVYSYQFVFRGMKRIHKNGIYEGSNGASNTFYLRLTELNKDGYTQETIAVMDYHSDYFEVEGAEVSFEEYCDYAQEIESVELAETLEFTEDMLADCLLGDSSENRE